MNYKKLILFIIPVFGIYCAEKKGNNKLINNDSAIVQTKINVSINELNAYDDIDLFNIKGIGKLKNPTTYPYIKIEDQSNLKKRVVYKHSAEDSTERFYERKDNYWLGYYEFRADSGYHRTYEYIKKDTIIRLFYNGSHMKSGFHLDDIYIIERSKCTMYSYWKKIGPFMEPDINNLNLIKDKVNVNVTENFSIKNGILTIYSKSIDKVKNQVFERDTSCFNIGEHSWFWFQRFGWSNKAKCN